ncbi:MAG: type II toxin-antitoxin system HicB family antitoxin [Verrucomicrobia bacterium]|nr:type II toxin-antitoxin system HicB family antitoxin [Verrucomicrobiota bacterium]
MTQDTYAVIIFWSSDDEAFIASVSELPGCMAHGETRAQAIEQIEIAIENWIDTAREIGREIPSPTQDWAAKEKELEEKARESLKIGFENAMPEIIEALAKEIARPGTDVLLRYTPGLGLQWMTRKQATETTLTSLVRGAGKYFDTFAAAKAQKSKVADGRPIKRTDRKS